MTKRVVVVGGGPAGLSAATEVRRHGIAVVVLEREANAGGIPRHSHHQGFGLRDLHRSLSGPKYARVLVERALRCGVEISTSTTVRSIAPGVVATTSAEGLREIEADAVIVATGARERPRSARLIPGDRPNGVLTTGQLQNLVHVGGLPVGKRALVVGAELVSYSAVMTLRHAGVEVVGMTTELASHQSVVGTALAFRLRYGVPLLASTRVAGLEGKGRLRSVTIEDVVTGAQRTLHVDTIVFSGDWIPDHELSRRAGLLMDAGTQGPATDVLGETSVPGIWGAGNLLHPVETADVASLRARRIGAAVAEALTRGPFQAPKVALEHGAGLSWVWPNRIALPTNQLDLSLRPSVLGGSTTVSVVQGEQILGQRRLRATVPNRHKEVSVEVNALSDAGSVVVRLGN